MTASALKTFRRNWIHRGGNDFRKIIALANMSFRTGTPYPPMPVLDDVVLMPYPRVTLRSPWAIWLLPPLQGLFSGKSELVRTLSFSSMNSWVLQIENLSTAGNFKLKENLILWHKPSKRLFCIFGTLFQNFQLDHTGIVRLTFQNYFFKRGRMTFYFHCRSRFRFRKSSAVDYVEGKP